MNMYPHLTNNQIITIIPNKIKKVKKMILNLIQMMMNMSHLLCLLQNENI